MKNNMVFRIIYHSITKEEHLYTSWREIKLFGLITQEIYYITLQELIQSLYLL
jgi:hypothetical protein